MQRVNLMAERKLTKSEQALKIRDPKAFAERMKRKKGRRPLTAKTIRDAGQGKGKAAKTAMEKRADQANRKARRQALQKGASAAKAKQAGKKAAMAVVGGSNIKTAINLGMVAANFTPFGKVAKGVKGLRSLIKGGSKSKTPPKPPVKKTPKSPTTTPKQRADKAMEGAPSKSNTPFRSRKGNENKSQKALESKPKTTPKADLTPRQKKTVRRAKIIGGTGLGVGVGTGLAIGDLLTSDISKKPTGKMSASEARKLDAKTADEVGSRKMKPTPVKKLDLSYRPDEGSPSGTASKKSTIFGGPSKKRGKYEGGIDYYDTPFGRIKADSSDEAFNFDVQEKDGGYLKKDMMKKRKHGGFLGKGAGKAQRGYQWIVKK